jgi:hypothetical protein
MIDVRALECCTTTLTANATAVAVAMCATSRPTPMVAGVHTPKVTHFTWNHVAPSPCNQRKSWFESSLHIQLFYPSSSCFSVQAQQRRATRRGWRARTAAQVHDPKLVVEGWSCAVQAKRLGGNRRAFYSGVLARGARCGCVRARLCGGGCKRPELSPSSSPPPSAARLVSPLRADTTRAAAASLKSPRAIISLVSLRAAGLVADAGLSNVDVLWLKCLCSSTFVRETLWVLGESS